jgi:hypothetical protein
MYRNYLPCKNGVEISVNMLAAAVVNIPDGFFAKIIIVKDDPAMK